MCVGFVGFEVFAKVVDGMIPWCLSLGCGCLGVWGGCGVCDCGFLFGCGVCLAG